MKHFPILNGHCMVAVLPEGATNLQVVTIHQGSKSFPSLKYDRPDLVRGFVDLPPGNWRIVSTLADLTEEDAKAIVDCFTTDEEFRSEAVFRDYSDKSFYDTALESLESAIRSEGYAFSNPHGKSKMQHCSTASEPGDFAYLSREWEQVQSRVLCRERCLLLRGVDG